jgi:hypothetical protein
MFCLVLDSQHLRTRDQHWCPPLVNSLARPSASIHLRHAAEEGNCARGCPTTTGHQPRDSLAERSSEPENKGYQPNTTGRGVDQEIRDLEAIHQQVQRKREKMLWLADLRRKINEVDEKMCHITQDDQG